MAGTDVISHLPTDIVDEVISHIRGDPDTLRACTLLNADWTVSARRQLFASASVHLDDPKKCTRPDLLDSAAKHLRAFAAFLDHTLYVCSFIKKFQLVSGLSPSIDFYDESDSGSDYNLGGSDTDDVDYHVHLRDLFLVLRKLPALRNLVVTATVWSPLAKDGALNPKTVSKLKCPWITSLTISTSSRLSSYPISSTQVAAILHLLPGLSELSIHCGGIRLRGWTVTAQTIMPQDMSLRTLILKGKNTSFILPSLAYIASVDTLESLEFGPTSLRWHDIGRMGVFFDSVGPQLKHLRLSNMGYRPRVPIRAWHDLHLHKCTALHTLQLEANLGKYGGQSWHIVCVVLNRLRKACSGLQQFTLILVEDVWCMSDHRLLEHLSTLQTRLLAFPALKSVRFINRMPEMPNSFLRDSLPALQDKGLLKFDDEC